MEKNSIAIQLILVLITSIKCAPANVSSVDGVNQNPSTYYEWETKLRHDLTKNYDAQVIPLKESGKPLAVKIGLALNAIFKICPEKHKFSGNYFLRMEWEDLRLKWDPTKYGGLQKAYSFDTNDIWMPDITLYYGFTDIPGKFSRGPFTMVDHDGKVTWVPQVTIKVHCQPLLPSSTANGTDEDHTKHHHHILHQDGDEFADLKKGEKEEKGEKKDKKGEKKDENGKKARKNESGSEDSEKDDDDDDEDKEKEKKGEKKKDKKEGENKKKSSDGGDKGHKGCHAGAHHGHSLSGHKYDNLIEHCDIKFGSWIYDTKALSLEPFAGDTGIDMSVMQYEHKKKAGEKKAKTTEKKEDGKIYLTPRHDMTWEILENKVKTHQLKYPCCPDEYADITFHLKLKKVHDHHHKHQEEEKEGEKKESDNKEEGAKTGATEKKADDSTTADQKKTI